jgi:hypothetical protein
MKTLRLLLLVGITFAATVLALVVSAHSADGNPPEAHSSADTTIDTKQTCTSDDSQACSMERSVVPELSEVAVVDEPQIQVAATDEQEMAHSMSSMSHKHMDMGPHMKMTTVRPGSEADRHRADEIVQKLRPAIDKYKDVHVAERDGFKQFLPNVPQQMYHFTNWRYAIEAAFHFNPEHPTSLLYEKHGSKYELIGAMYTAPKRFNEDELNERVPLSVAQWHEHVNLCAPPKGRESEMLEKNPRFGLAGSITTSSECDAAGGTFYPIVFNWMVHVYPFEKETADVWAVERQMAHKH